MKPTILLAMPALCLAFVLISPATAAPRFAAMLNGGQRIEGERLHNWHEPERLPALDKHKLLEPGNPMLWLRDRTLSPGPTPQAYLETITGDRMPGTVVGFVRRNQDFTATPPHLLVRPGIDISPPNSNQPPTIRVLSESLAKVVWRRTLRVEDYHPGTLFYRDGRRQTFRAARFGDDSVQLLLQGGRETIAYREIGELHLPQQDPWQAYYRELATLSPDGKVRLLQISSIDGLVATGSLARFQVQTHGNAGDSARWWHAVQPAWSLDPLWINSNRIWVRRSWAPNEVPLSRFRPSAASSRDMLGQSGWPWRANRNDQGGVIDSTETAHGGGFGVHAWSELTFDLSVEAVAVRSWASLDRLSGDGGCVIARVLAGATARRQLYQSPHLVGSKQVVRHQLVEYPEPA